MKEEEFNEKVKDILSENKNKWLELKDLFNYCTARGAFYVIVVEIDKIIDQLYGKDQQLNFLELINEYTCERRMDIISL